MTSLAVTLGFIGAGLFLAGFVQAVRGTETWRRWRAAIGGNFWLPCPSCGAYFGGNEWLHDGVHQSTVPVGESGLTGQGICPSCTLSGVGDRAWAEFSAR